MAEGSDDLRGELLRAMSLASAIGLDLACLLGVGLLAGHIVDGHLHSSPVGLLVGVVAGLTAGIASVWVLLRRFVAPRPATRGTGSGLEVP